MTRGSTIHTFIRRCIRGTGTGISHTRSMQGFRVLSRRFGRRSNALATDLGIIHPGILRHCTSIVRGIVCTPGPSGEPLPGAIRVLSHAARAIGRTSRDVQRTSRSIDPGIQRTFSAVRREVGGRSSRPSSRATPSIRPSTAGGGRRHWF